MRFQITIGAAHHRAPVWRHALHAVEDAHRFLLLGGRQVLPGLHASQNAFPLIGRQAVEAFETILQLLLALRRKAWKLGSLWSFFSCS